MTVPRTPTLDEPRTEAGRRLFEVADVSGNHAGAEILAIEAEARQATLDEVERVVRDHRGYICNCGADDCPRVNAIVSAISQLRGSHE